jgi:hypothetical protein
MSNLGEIKKNQIIFGIPQIHGFRLEDQGLLFYIRPADGFQLSGIMQWVKQAFAVRFNVY